MTLRERLQKHIQDIDGEIDGARAGIHVLVTSPNWDTPGRIHEQASRIAVFNNRIFALLHRRRGLQEALKLIEFHVSKSSSASAEMFGI